MHSQFNYVALYKAKWHANYIEKTDEIVGRMNFF
jgi:hypothetical protein